MPLKIQLKPYEPNRTPYPTPPTMWAGDGMLEAAEAGANHGVIHEISPDAQIAGSATRQYLNQVLKEDGDYRDYVPTPPKPQSGNGADSMKCVSGSYCSDAATITTYLYHTEQLDNEQQTFLENNGYFDENGRIAFDERMLAKESGTTPQGNSMDKVAATAERIGLSPARPYDWSKFTWEDYYNPPTPQKQFDLGKRFLELFKLDNLWIVLGGNGSNQDVQATIANYMKYGPLQFATTTHCTETTHVDGVTHDYFDSYAPWNRQRDIAKVPALWVKQIYVIPKSKKLPIPYLPYFEKLITSPAVYAYDKDTDTMIGIDSGEAFHAFVGDYTKIKTVEKLIRPVDKRILKIC